MTALTPEQTIPRTRTRPTPNVDLLRRTLAHIEAHPENWNQVEYRFPGGLCFAGRAAVLDGGQWRSPDDLDPFDWHMVAVDADPRGIRTEDGKYVLVVMRAQRILGLDHVPAMTLFDAENTLSDLRRFVDELCSGVTS